MIEGLVYLVIYIIVIGLICWLLTYLVDAVPLPAPFNRVAKVAIVVIGVLIIIILLLHFLGAVPSPRL